MADWDDVRRALEGLPGVVEEAGDAPAWKVRTKVLLWERPLRRYEVAELGPAMRDVDVLAARVPDIAVREALIAEDPETFFTTSHFRDYPAVLCWLDRVSTEQLYELAHEAWLAQAPATLRRARPAD